jgi:TolB-like protein/Tfp pilus assembly protein PilF
VQGLRSNQGTVCFGPFELDQAAGELRKNGAKIRLQDQPLQVLQILLEQPGKIVPREELQRRIWPSDTFVDFDHGINNAIKRLREALGDTAETPRYIETVPRRGYRFIGTVSAAAETGTGEIRSVAVLPLENLSGDPEQEYFADGLTEALITTLAKIGSLRVVSRTTAMHYKKAHRPVREIARELAVEAIVEGAVLRSSERVRISVQLIDARNDSHLWAENYDRNLRDVLGLHSEVSQAIAREVRVKLTPEEEARFAQVHPIDPAAYEAYLKGRYHWNRRNAGELPRAMQCFEDAIARDPGYAAAYAGLADSLTTIAAWSFAPPRENCEKAKALALQAMQMDPALAEPHVSVGWIHAWYDFDFPAAEREFERALELNPRYPTAHYWFGYFLALMGRHEEAYTEIVRAIRLDPLSPVHYWGLGVVYWSSRQYDHAIESFEKVIDMDSTFVGAYAFLGWTCLCTSHYERAVAAGQRATELSQGAPMFRLALAHIHAAAGKRQEALKIVKELQDRSKLQYVTPYGLARVYTALEEKEEAIRWLQTAYKENATWMVFLKTDPHLDPLRLDPRFQELLRRMNFSKA